MTETPYNMPPLGLFGKRCRILTGYDKRSFVYRIVNSGLRSNTWSEPPLTYWSETEPVRHGHSEDVLIVVCDTLIDEKSRLIRVALKDVELMDEAPTIEAEPVKHGRWIPVYMLTSEGILPDEPIGYMCSQCNARRKKRLNYCSNCGTRMDGEGKDDDSGME